MKKSTRLIVSAVATLALALGMGAAVAAPASAGGSNCQTISIDSTPGGFKASIQCSETYGGWLDGRAPTTSIYKGAGNTPADALSYATWMAYNATDTAACHDVTTSEIPGGYNVVYTCSGRFYFPNGSGPDLNTAGANANYMFVLFR